MRSGIKQREDSSKIHSRGSLEPLLERVGEWTHMDMSVSRVAVLRQVVSRRLSSAAGHPHVRL